MKNIIKYSVLYCIIAVATIMSKDASHIQNELVTGNIPEHVHYFDKDSIVKITTEDELIDLLKNSQGPSAISFHMDRCGWCIKMHPIFEALSNDDQFNHISFYSVNGPAVQAHTHVKNILNEPVTGYPTMFFMNQGIVVDKNIGGASHAEISKKMSKLSHKTKPPVKEKSSTQAKHAAKKIAAAQAQKEAKKSQARKAMSAKIAYDRSLTQSSENATVVAA